jgi:hypothetical protein
MALNGDVGQGSGAAGGKADKAATIPQVERISKSMPDSTTPIKVCPLPSDAGK